MLKNARWALVAGAAFMAAGCTAYFKAYPYAMVNPNISLGALTRSEYTVLGDVEGRAEGGRILFFPLVAGNPKMFQGHTGSGMQAAMQARMGGQVAAGLGIIEQVALYNAMESQPDADAVIAIRIIKGERTVIPFLYRKESIILKGKAIKIKAG